MPSGPQTQTPPLQRPELQSLGPLQALPTGPGWHCPVWHSPVQQSLPVEQLPPAPWQASQLPRLHMLEQHWLASVQAVLFCWQVPQVPL